MMTTDELQKIIATLPIGYYVGSNIDVEVKEDTEVHTSYYDPKKNAITICGKIINDGLSRLPENYDTEKAVRSMLYHEVSHALLTPNWLSMSDVMNVFEDERIETLLADYYMNVNFKEQVFAINNYNGEAPKDGWDYFYQVTRFRIGDEEDLKRVEDIILYAKDMNSDKNNTNYTKCSNYERKVLQFYNDCCAKYGKPAENHTYNNAWGGGEPQTTQNGGGDKNGTATEISDEVRKQIEKICEDNKKNKVFKVGGRSGGFSHACHELLKKSVCGIDESLTDEIKQIFNSYKSRQLNNGKAMNGYSGIFDPRSVARDDYKYFIRPCSKGSGQGFSKFNLNLFIDCSGSYEPNVNRTNCLIRSLEAIEKENPAFTFTVTCMEVGEWTLPKDNRYIEAKGGNNLDEHLTEIYNDLQRGDAVNYNIVLFDGYTSGGKHFSAFNHNNVSILSDNDNEHYINLHAPSAKSTFLRGGYAEKLTAEVCKILKIAFC